MEIHLDQGHVKKKTGNTTPTRPTRLTICWTEIENIKDNTGRAILECMAQRYSSWKLFGHGNPFTDDFIILFHSSWMMTSIHVIQYSQEHQEHGEHEERGTLTTFNCDWIIKNQKKSVRSTGVVSSACFVMEYWTNGVCWIGVCVNVLLLGWNERLALIAMYLSPGRQSGHNQPSSSCHTLLALSPFEFLYSLCLSFFLWWTQLGHKSGQIWQMTYTQIATQSKFLYSWRLTSSVSSSFLCSCLANDEKKK